MPKHTPGPLLMRLEIKGGDAQTLDEAMTIETRINAADNRAEAIINELADMLRRYEMLRQDRDILAEQVERAAAVTRERERIATETATNRTRREERARAVEICQWLANTWDRDSKLTRLRREERGEAAGEIMREIHRESVAARGAA